MKKCNRVLTVRVTDDMMQKIESLAMKMDTHISVVLRRLIERGLEDKTPDSETGLVYCGCGGTPKFHRHPGYGWFIVMCVECNIATSWRVHREDAINIWNTAMGMVYDRKDITA